MEGHRSLGPAAPFGRILGLFIAIVAQFLPDTARADGPPIRGPVTLVFSGGQEPEEQPWSDLIRARFAERAQEVIPSLSGWVAQRAHQAGTFEPARLDELERVEQLLTQARELAGSLHEGRALALLAQALAVAEANADLPGSSAWIAETSVAMGLVAHQAGLSELSELQFARAATLDSTRVLRAGEAPPNVIARLSEVLRSVGTRPVGTFTVRVEPVHASANVFIDDVALPGRLVEVPAGTHVLRVEAPGYLPYGTVMNVLEGERPLVVVRLSPRPALEIALAIERSAEHTDLSAMSQSLAELEAREGLAATVCVIEPSSVSDRALVHCCLPGTCLSPVRLEGEDDPITFNILSASDVMATLDVDRAWLAAAPRFEEASWWEHWTVWVGAGAVLTSAAVALAIALAPEPEQRLQVQVGFDDLR